MIDPSLSKSPRMGEFSDRPGKYVPVVRIYKQVLNPGECLEGEVFFTGYGEINVAKLQFTPSFGLFRKEGCTLWSGMMKEDQGDGSAIIKFGGEPSSFDGSNGVTIHLNGGLKSERWERSTMFFDRACVPSSVPQISTECVLDKAPIEFKLDTLKSARPGAYSIRFILTYFDGVAWQTEAQEEIFRIRSFLDRWQISITMIGAAAALSAIFTAGVEIYKWFC